MIRKKVSMLGAFATGKTSLVRQFVHGLYQEKYHTTVGVKVDKKDVMVDGNDVHLLLWDIAGWDEFQDVRPSYLRGSSGFVLVVDGTRRETLTDAVAIVDFARQAANGGPVVVALNKHDLASEWEVSESQARELFGDTSHLFTTSAKTGKGVEAAFEELVRHMLADS